MKQICLCFPFTQGSHRGFHRSWKVLKFEKCPGTFWHLLIFMKILEKSWNFTQYLSNEVSFPISL